MPKLTVGFLVYSDLKYIPYFLESLSKQTIVNDVEILCLDNASKENIGEVVKRSSDKFPNGIKVFRMEENIGFAPGHNYLMKKANTDYYACLNSDMVFESNCLERLLDEFSKDEKLASLCPKLLQWDFERNRRTNIIDSTGMFRTIFNSFYERGQAEQDKGQYDNSTDIFGCSGAFVLYDLGKLKKLGEYFDNSFFMYKEDVDLAWRLNNAGFKAKMLPDIFAWHDRTVALINKNFFVHNFSRKAKRSDLNRALSTRNHLKMLKKNMRLKDGVPRFFATIGYEFAKFIFVILFDWKMVKEYRVLFKKV